MTKILAYSAIHNDKVFILDFIHITKPGFTALHTETVVKAIIVDRAGRISDIPLSHLTVEMEKSKKAA